MPNIEAKTHKHNKNTLEKAQQKHPDTQLCNCTNKKQCRLNGQCFTESIVYKVNIMANHGLLNTRSYMSHFEDQN